MVPGQRGDLSQGEPCACLGGPGRALMAAPDLQPHCLAGRSEGLCVASSPASDAFILLRGSTRWESPWGGLGFRSTPGPHAAGGGPCRVWKPLSSGLAQCGAVKSWAWPAPQVAGEGGKVLTPAQLLVSPAGTGESEDARPPRSDSVVSVCAPGGCILLP